MDRDALDKKLVQAHAEENVPGLIALYTTAADQCEASGDVNAACFYLTHAFVFALQSGAAEADVLNLRLFKHGREVRQEF